MTAVLSSSSMPSPLLGRPLPVRTSGGAASHPRRYGSGREHPGHHHGRQRLRGPRRARPPGRGRPAGARAGAVGRVGRGAGGGRGRAGPRRHPRPGLPGARDGGRRGRLPRRRGQRVLLPRPGGPLPRQRRRHAQRRARGRRGRRPAGRLHVLGGDDRRGARHPRVRGLPPPRPLPVPLRALQAAGRGRRPVGVGPARPGAGVGEPGLGPGARAHARHGAGSSSTPSTAGCAWWSTRACRWSTWPTAPRATCWPRSAAPRASATCCRAPP